MSTCVLFIHMDDVVAGWMTQLSTVTGLGVDFGLIRLRPANCTHRPDGT
jgi:hypothetical protein